MSISISCASREVMAEERTRSSPPRLVKRFRPFARRVEDRNDLDPLAEPVYRDIRGSSDEHFSCRYVAAGSAHLGLIGERGHGFDNASDHVFGRTGTIGRNINTYIFKVLEGRIGPMNFIH